MKLELQRILPASTLKIVFQRFGVGNASAYFRAQFSKLMRTNLFKYSRLLQAVTMESRRPPERLVLIGSASHRSRTRGKTRSLLLISTRDAFPYPISTVFAFDDVCSMITAFLKNLKFLRKPEIEFRPLSLYVSKHDTKCISDFFERLCLTTHLQTSFEKLTLSYINQ